MDATLIRLAPFIIGSLAAFALVTIVAYRNARRTAPHGPDVGGSLMAASPTQLVMMWTGGGLGIALLVLADIWTGGRGVELLGPIATAMLVAGFVFVVLRTRTHPVPAPRVALLTKVVWLVPLAAVLIGGGLVLRTIMGPTVLDIVLLAAGFGLLPGAVVAILALGAIRLGRSMTGSK